MAARRWLRARRSLQTRFVLAIAALVAVVLVANGLVLAATRSSELRDDIEQHGQAYARLSVRQICEAYETYYASGYSKFREVIQETMRLEHDLVRLAIYDTGGHVLFDSRELESGQAELLEPARRPAAPDPDPAMLQAVKNMSLTARTAAPGGGRRLYVVVAPFLEEWGRHRYSVAFYLGDDSLRLAAKAAWWRIFWLAAGSLALGVLIASMLASESMGPIEALTRGARDLANGRLERRIELPGGDEFGVLAATFNQMAEALSRTISDLETSNRALGQMNLELQQLDRMKSDLLANVSHELRTPLTAIQGFSEAMEEGLLGEVNDQQRDAFRVVQRNTRRLMGMIDQLLGFSRIEAGVTRLDLAAFDLGEVAAQVVGSVRAVHGPELDLGVEVAAGGGVAAGGAGAGAAGAAGAGAAGAGAAGLPPVWGDPGRIAQVLENLVTNAVKFTPPGRRIRVRLARCGAEAEVTVADQGIGIPADSRAKIFERFYQVDGSSTRRYGGMGLGLAIVREILAAHGRLIEVESEVGRGTSFRFTLPFAEAGAGAGAAVATAAGGAAAVDAAAGGAGVEVARAAGVAAAGAAGEGAAGAAAMDVAVAGEAGVGAAGGAAAAGVPGEAARGAEARSAARGRRVALIDDDPGFARLLADFLGRSGFVVDVMATAQAGFERVVASRPDLVLLDRLLPDGDGFDLLGRLRRDERTSRIPVLVVSIRKERALGLRLGASGYLVKPVRPARVKDMILEALGQPRDAPADGPEVLVVDDDDDLRRLLVERLQRDGLRAHGAADGGEALQLIAARPPALVLLDLMMPDMDGWEVLRRLRAEPATAELPVIVLSARDGADERAAGEELHVLDFVGKPFDLGSLLEEIERALADGPAAAARAARAVRAAGAPAGPGAQTAPEADAAEAPAGRREVSA